MKQRTTVERVDSIQRVSFCVRALNLFGLLSSYMRKSKICPAESLYVLCIIRDRRDMFAINLLTRKLLDSGEWCVKFVSKMRMAPQCL